MSLEHELINLARVVDRHVDRKAPKVLGPHIDQFAEVISVGPPMIFHLMHTNIMLPQDVMYFLPSCAPDSLAQGDVVLVVGVFNEHVVVGHVASGSVQATSPPSGVARGQSWFIGNGTSSVRVPVEHGLMGIPGFYTAQPDFEGCVKNTGPATRTTFTVQFDVFSAAGAPGANVTYANTGTGKWSFAWFACL